jgi:hypothetical protein
VFRVLGAGSFFFFFPVSANIVSCGTSDILSFQLLMFSLEVVFTKMSLLLIVH